MLHARAQLARHPTAIAAPVGIPPGDDGAIALQGRKGKTSGEYLHHARAQLARHPTAIAAIERVSPGNDGAIYFKRRKGASGRKDLNNTKSETISHITTISTVSRPPPGHYGPISLKCGKRPPIPEFTYGPSWLGDRNSGADHHRRLLHLQLPPCHQRKDSVVFCPQRQALLLADHATVVE